MRHLVVMLAGLGCGAEPKRQPDPVTEPSHGTHPCDADVNADAGPPRIAYSACVGTDGYGVEWRMPYARLPAGVRADRVWVWVCDDCPDDMEVHPLVRDTGDPAGERWHSEPVLRLTGTYLPGHSSALDCPNGSARQPTVLMAFTDEAAPTTCVITRPRSRVGELFPDAPADCSVVCGD